MTTVFKLFSSLFLLALSMSLFGCPNAQEIASSLAKALDAEQIEYKKLVMVKDQRGETSSEVLENWAANLANVNGRVAAVIARLEKYPEERAKVEDDLQILETRVTKIYQREDSLTLEYVPAWKMSAAVDAVDRIQHTLLDLQRNYQTLFDKDPLAHSKTGEVVSIDLVVDEELYDTYNDCVDRIKLFGLAQDDPNCETEALSRCGHQMDLDCVNKVLLLNALSSCTVEVYGKDGEVSYKQSAAWLNELNRCRSSSLILR